MTFTESVSTCLKKFADFEGRARRSEYWWFILFLILLDIGIKISAGILSLSQSVSSGFSVILALLTLLPLIAVSTRRLHDVGRSGWWQLIEFTIIGIIPLFYWFCIEGDAQANQYGPPV